MRRHEVHRLVVEAVSEAAERAGIQAGDVIVGIDGTPPLDVLDLEFAAADGVFELEIERLGRRSTHQIEMRHGESHGLTLEHALGVPPRRCENACLFCFVDQVPEGLRSGLSVKDDDYRLSFLRGNFITLTNLKREDIARIIDLRLTPLYVSLHDWDDHRRARLMGKSAGKSRETLQRLLRAGIKVHIQIVLCPGWNDGEALRETLGELAVLDGVVDVGVVPVSLATEGRLHRVTAADAEAALALIEEFQKRLQEWLGRRFVHAADELYLLCGMRPPESDAGEQYENGIGICAAFVAEAKALELPPDARVALLTGTLAAPIVAAVCGKLAGGSARDDSRSARPYVVENQLFGPHVTVTGLLGGRELLARLREEPLAEGEWLLAPRTFLPSNTQVTLDDVSEADIRTACRGRFIVAETLAHAFGRLSL